MPAWRNGRRTGLKILSSQERIGSSPIAGTTEKPLYMVDFNQICCISWFFLFVIFTPSIPSAFPKKRNVKCLILTRQIHKKSG